METHPYSYIPQERLSCSYPFCIVDEFNSCLEMMYLRTQDTQRPHTHTADGLHKNLLQKSPSAPQRFTFRYRARRDMRQHSHDQELFFIMYMKVWPWLEQYSTVRRLYATHHQTDDDLKLHTDVRVCSNSRQPTSHIGAFYCGTFIQ